MERYLYFKEPKKPLEKDLRKPEILKSLTAKSWAFFIPSTMNSHEFFNQIVYARAYFLTWNPIVVKCLGLEDQMITADINRIKLLLLMLEKINARPS